jgi:hypothetical protein
MPVAKSAPRALLTASFLSVLGVMPAVARPTEPPYGLPLLDRYDFNRLAAEANLPVFWREDREGDGKGRPDPAEIVVYDGKRTTYIDKREQFTRAFEKVYRTLVESRRQEALRRELMQGRPTLVETDVSAMSDEDRKVLRVLDTARAQIDRLYQIQTGASLLRQKLSPADPTGRAVFERNQRPECEAPLTQNDPFCSALADFSRAIPTVWPREDAAEFGPEYCAKIAAAPNAKELMNPFTVVKRDRKGALVAIPYHKAFSREMKAVSTTLKAAAKLIKSPDEAPFRAYLLAAADAFVDDSWERADEAWAAMSAENSRWYLRIGPDETYWDPCQLKAGFHMSFARVNRGSLAWKERLAAIRKELEDTFAALIGPPYAARAVDFELPEFIDIIANAGDARSGIGATVGQSLPNFGKVAAESRGRTVAMANIYTDPDSLEDFKTRDTLLWGPETLVFATEDPSVEQLGTVLHEATHNLGPYAGTLVSGKTLKEVFGGPTEAILEELKAQTGALYYMPLLAEKGLIEKTLVRKSWVASISWAFGHISRGMVDGDGQPKTYSQLSAIQVGELVRAGAMRWVDGADGGRFELDFDKAGPVIVDLMKRVGQIMATGDVAGAKALIERNVSKEGLALIHADAITERSLRFARPSFIYAMTGE